MVDNDGRWKRREEIVEFGELLRFEIDDDVPAERFDALGDLLDVDLVVLASPDTLGAAGAMVAGRLYLIAFTATRDHGFAAHWPAVAALLRSARIGPG